MQFRSRLILLCFLTAGGATYTSATPFSTHARTNRLSSLKTAHQGAGHAYRDVYRISTTNPNANANVSTNSLPPREAEIVYSPPITNPTKGEHVIAGQPFTVTWKTCCVPPEKRNSDVEIVLGHPQGGNEHLDVAHPLKKVPIMAGKASVTAPADTPTRNDYVIVVLGDSGNKSPPFTIENKHHI